MDIILIPGLWLDASSWNDVSRLLEQKGHRPRPLTLPGLGGSGAETAGISIAEWVDAASSAVDAVDGPVVVVGHSGGGNVAWGVADARPERVARVIFVDTVPPAPGFGINEFELTDGVVPFPGWDFFPSGDVYDLDAATRARTASLTASVPGRVPADPIELSDTARHRVPVTLLMGSMDRDELEKELENWGPFAHEFHAIADAEVARIGSGHWPQFSAPQRLAQLIDEAVRR
ncbi:alpha/beta fold hydrolase [Microbacterium sp. XT11]|uniref:alpha/beta fold hydrolase n=1 Tax=Microbacterium sp. XT11 TaxID=367477 RepID=UPI000831CE30|nr:alpha/beta hydrolase [Microbacterium sp. XT11]